MRHFDSVSYHCRKQSSACLLLVLPFNLFCHFWRIPRITADKLGFNKPHTLKGLGLVFRHGCFHEYLSLLHPIFPLKNSTDLHIFTHLLFWLYPDGFKPALHHEAVPWDWTESRSVWETAILKSSFSTKTHIWVRETVKVSQVAKLVHPHLWSGKWTPKEWLHLWPVYI